MGLESYLLNIEFIEPIPEDKLVSLFSAAGMTHLGDKKTGETLDDFRSYYFEIRSEQGLTEAHCIFIPSEVMLQDFSLIFSILSPRHVIHQIFKFLTELSAFNPVLIMDTEIRNHYYRQLRKEGKVDQSFGGIDEEEESKIENLCYIPLDVEIFKQNELGINKRKVVIDNERGQIIEGGTRTIEYIEKKGLFNRFFGWIKREL